ncbi:hypothetical protein LXL04_031594 [Taraxacum kok-saghyz]
MHKYFVPMKILWFLYALISLQEAYAHLIEKCITLGPWGRSMGTEWIYFPDGFIKKIRISHKTNINGIEFHSENSEGRTQKLSFGVLDGNRTDTICIDYPDEYLTSLSGALDNSGQKLLSLYFHTNQNRYGPYGSEGSKGRGARQNLSSLCFHTNQNRYGPSGSEGSRGSFSYDGKGGVAVGFYGRLDACNHITAIGFYVMPKSLAMDRYSTFTENSRPQKCCRMAEVEIPRDVGPWGASGGKAWDDGVFSNIKQVRVQIGDPSNVIFGIQFKYVKKDGKCILSRLHGGIDGGVSEVEINLDGSEEYLTGISGFYGPVEGFDELKGVTYITFHTNKKKHGPYGQESGEGCVYFTSTPSCGKVVGFHGRNGDSLTAIGVHMEYL